MVAVDDELVEVSPRLQRDFRAPRPVTIRAVHDKLRIKNKALAVVGPVIEITREIDQVRLRRVGREEYAPCGAPWFPHRVARAGNEHVTGGTDVENGILVAIQLVN